MKNFPTATRIEKALRAGGHSVFTEGRYNLNIFGIRTADNGANRFNDIVGVMYREDGRWVCFQFPATTDPGTYWRENPMNVRGTAILRPGQYRGSHKIGKHKKYLALKQRRPVNVYRDNNKDKRMDFGVGSETGMFGINIHRASSSRASTRVNKWSAGCQVIADPAHFNFFMSIARKSKPIWGNVFTYTLLTTKDF